MSAPLRAAWLAVVLACPAVRAQTSPTLLQRLTILNAKKAASVDRGEAVAISLETPEKTEIAILGIVRIEVPRAFYIERAWHHGSFLSAGTKSLSGAFGEPARLNDVAALELDPGDAKALAKCRPLDCNVKLPAADMERFRAQLASLHSPAPRADSLMREWLVEYVNAYRADSMEETVVYDDTKRPVRSSNAFRALLSEPMLAGLDSEPFTAMLATPRSARPHAVGSRIFWEFDHPSGLKPLLEVLERSMYSSPARPDVNWMTTKLLYASHYFESQLDFMTVADAPSSPGSRGMYIVVLRRSKFDDLPSGGLFNIRGRAVRKLRDALRTTLANTREELRNAYADSASPPPHAP